MFIISHKFTRLRARVLPGTRGLLLVSAILLASPAWSFVSTPDYGGPFVATWNGVGDVIQTSSSQCVISTDDAAGKKGKPGSGNPGDGKQQKYHVSANVSGSPGFTLHKIDAGNTIPFTLSYINNGKKPVKIAIPRKLYGGFDGGDNNTCDKFSQFEVYIAEADLRGMPVGTYRAIVNVTHTTDKTNEAASGSLEISLRITAEAFDITALDNLVLGSWDGAATSLIASETFCVSGTASLYKITANGEAAGFTLSNGTDTIIYEVRFAPGPDASNGQPLLDGVPEGSYTLENQCVGDNTALYVETVSPLDSLSAGAYSGQLTLTIEPT